MDIKTAITSATFSQVIPCRFASCGSLLPRLCPISATAAACIPSPKENDKLSAFIPTWCAAIAAVPMSAAITAVDIKPIRIRICSTNVLLESFKIIFTDSNRFHSPSFIIYGILRKESFRNSDITLIVHPTTVPSTVASAAPRIPSLGKPRWPPIKR